MQLIFRYCFLTALAFGCDRLIAQFSTSNNQRVKIDSALLKMRLSKQDTNLAIAFQSAAKEYYYLGKADSIKFYSVCLMKLSEKLNYLPGIASAHNSMGLYHFTMGDYYSSLKEQLLAVSAGIKVGRRRPLANSYNNLGNTYVMLGNYPEAMKQLTSSLKIITALKDSAGIADVNNNMAGIYGKQKQYDLALASHFTALEIRKKINDLRGISKSMHNIGLIYWDLFKYDSSLKYYDSSLVIKKKLGNLNLVASQLSSIGDVYTSIGKFDLAKLYQDSALNVFKTVNKDAEPVKILKSLGYINIQMRKFDLAESFFLKAQKASENTGDLESVSDCFKQLSLVYEGTKRFKQAFEAYKKYIVIRDSIFNEENTKKTIQTQMQYDFDKRSAADSIKNSEAKKFEEIKHQQEISKQKTFTYGGIAGFVVMIFVAGISFRAFKNKKKANVLIAHQKELVEEKQKEILDSIYYAKRIQTALITSEKYITRTLNRLTSN